MQEIIHNYDLSIFDDVQLKEMKKAMFLLNILVQKKDELNRLSVKKTDVARMLGKNPRTVAEWLRILARNGAIKYKYGGEIRVNPYFAYYGAKELYEDAVKEWTSFRSVVPVIKRTA